MRAFNFKIFARYGTTEKVLISCSGSQHSDIQKTLANKYGGEWLFVDSIDPFFEILHFNDTQEYRGWSPDIERYSDAIDTVADPLSDTKAMVGKIPKVLLTGVSATELAYIESLFKASSPISGGSIGFDTGSPSGDSSVIEVYADGKLVDLVHDLPPFPYPEQTSIIDEFDMCMLEKECYRERLDLDEVASDKKSMRIKSQNDSQILYKNPYLKNNGRVNNKNNLRRYNKNSKIR